MPPPPIRAELETQVRVFRSERPLYAPGARNLGIQQSRGQYICFLDADDTYNPARLSTQINFLRQHPEVVFVGSRWEIYNNDHFERTCSPPYALLHDSDHDTLLPDNARQWICKWYPFHTSAVTCRRRFLEEINGFDETLRWGEEWDLMVRLAQLGPIGYVTHAGSNYMCRAGSICSTVNPVKHESGARIFSRWLTEVPELPCEFQAHLKNLSTECWLLAAQTHLENHHQPWPALKCSLKSLATKRSVWGVRSTIRASLYCICPFLTVSTKTSRQNSA